MNAVEVLLMGASLWSAIWETYDLIVNKDLTQADRLLSVIKIAYAVAVAVFVYKSLPPLT